VLDRTLQRVYLTSNSEDFLFLKTSKRNWRFKDFYKYFPTWHGFLVHFCKKLLLQSVRSPMVFFSVRLFVLSFFLHDKQTYSHSRQTADIQTDIQIYRQTGGQTYIQKYEQTDEQTDRQTEKIYLLKTKVSLCYAQDFLHFLVMVLVEFFSW
jgi:hypothetical protein